MYYDMHAEDTQQELGCTCGSCHYSPISPRMLTRIIYGTLQAMQELRREAERLEPGCVIDDPAMLCSYPYNWVPAQAQAPRREVLLGASSVLFAIYLILREGRVPDSETIRGICEKEPQGLPYTAEYFGCGGSVMHILQELTQEVESDLRREALNCDSDELIEALERIPPCAKDSHLLIWRRTVSLSL